MTITSLSLGLLIYLYEGVPDCGEEVLVIALLGRDGQGEVLAVGSWLWDLPILS